MADWTNLPNQAVGVGGLPSGTTVTALRDNPVAIAEGAPGAPRVQGKALGGLRLPAFSGTFNNWAGLTDLGDFSEIFFTGLIGVGPTSQQFQVRFSTDNGSTWGSAQNLRLMSPSTEVLSSLHLNLVSGDYSMTYGRAVENSSVTVPANVNALQLRTSQSNDIGFAMTAMVTGGRA